MPEYLQYVDVVLKRLPDGSRQLVNVISTYAPTVVEHGDDTYALRFPARFAELDLSTLPGWDAMSDVDKGAALMHIHKRDYEGAAYAEENYPARYIEHPELVALVPEDACAHAAQFEGIAEDLDPAEHHLLYDLALVATANRDRS